MNANYLFDVAKQFREYGRLSQVIAEESMERDTAVTRLRDAERWYCAAGQVAGLAADLLEGGERIHRLPDDKTAQEFIEEAFGPCRSL